jgi:hypothetical protein
LIVPEARDLSGPLAQPAHAAAPGGRISAGSIRGVYLWAGAATVRLQQIKFPDIDIDVDAHEHAHTNGAARQLNRAGFNLVFLAMNWGFPPEEEEPYWLQFRHAARVYHEQGFRVIGYVQASNCVARGSFATRNWYAITPRGRRIPYFRNRLMTCWNSSEWSQQVIARALAVLESGGDGVFFDNLWMGATPWTFGGAMGGFAGCACRRCATEFAAATGQGVVTSIRPGPVTREWLMWRAGIVEKRVTEWGNAVRTARPGAWVLANNSDVALRDTVSLFGLDPVRLAPLQDALLVENIAMPRFDARRRRLVANALPIKALRATIPGRSILSVTYERGIGLDGPPAPARLARAVAEICALGASPVVKGSEYIDAQGRFTVVTAPALASVLEGIAPVLDWVRRHESLYTDVRHDPDMFVLFDPAAFAHDFDAAASATFAVANALVADGVCFGFITPAQVERAKGRSILVPPGVQVPSGRAGMLLSVSPEWIRPIRPHSRFSNSRVLRALADPALRGIGRAYFEHAGVRRAFDRAGITARFLQSKYFGLPRHPSSIREHVRLPRPAARPHGPALVERWIRSDGTQFVHLVNYSDTVIRVALPPEWTDLTIHSPDPVSRLISDGGGLYLENYAVLQVNEPA